MAESGVEYIRVAPEEAVERGGVEGGADGGVEVVPSAAAKVDDIGVADAAEGVGVDGTEKPEDILLDIAPGVPILKMFSAASINCSDVAPAG